MEQAPDIIDSYLRKIEDFLMQALTGSEAEQRVNSLCLQMVRAGGKRLRPRLAVAAALCLGEADLKEEDVIRFAAALELLHTATLIHDDVIDRAAMRRGQPTINETDGNHVAVLAGDYMFTRSFAAMQSLDSMRLFMASNRAVTALVQGEFSQLQRVGDLSLSRGEYERVIYCKTGALFELAATGIAIHTSQERERIEALSVYGTKLGIGFQVVDDMLDYSSSSERLGKTVGEDLADGRITLPLIIARERLEGAARESFARAVAAQDLPAVLEFIGRTSALEACADYAGRAALEARQALGIFPESAARRELSALARQAVERSF